MFGKLRTYFLTGVVVASPIAITIWLVWWFVSLFDSWLKPYIPTIYNPDHYLPFTLPGVGLVFALVGNYPHRRAGGQSCGPDPVEFR